MALGTNAEMRRLAGPSTATVDLRQKTVIPGLIQTHYHTFTTAASRYGPEVGLVDPSVRLSVVAEDTPEATAKKLRDTITNAIRVRRIPQGQWITVALSDDKDMRPGTSRGWLYLGRLNKRQIDGVTPDNPVLITTRLQGIFNSAAVNALKEIFSDWDFAVLEKDFFTSPVDEILDMEVIMTGLNGEIVFDRDRLAGRKLTSPKFLNPNKGTAWAVPLSYVSCKP